MVKPLEIEVFKIGTHTSEDGRTLDFPAKLVDEAIEGYDPSKFRAPLIVSHDTGGYSDKDIVKSELAFGIVDSFRRVGESVFAQLKKYAPEFKRWVDEGRLHSISSSFYLPESSSNPNPGKLSFRHIAALGNNPPAVKGMTPIELREVSIPCFADGGDGTVSFSMPLGEPFGIISRMFRALRDQTIDTSDLETAENLMPSEAILALENMGETRYVSSNMLDAQLGDLWNAIHGIQAEHSMLHERLRCMEAPAVPTPPLAPFGTNYPPHYEELKPMAARYTKALAGIVEIDPSMGIITNFAKSLGVIEAEMGMVPGWHSGEMEIPVPKRKVLASFLGMSEEQFEALYKPDHEFEAAENSSELAKTQRLLAEAEATNQRLQQDLIARLAESRKIEITSFLEGEKRSGRVTPGMIRSQNVEFGDGKKETYDLVSFMCSLNDSQLAYMKKLLTVLPTQVTYSESTPIETDIKGEGALDFQQVGEMARRRIREAKAQGAELTEAQAVDLVMAENGIRY